MFSVAYFIIYTVFQKQLHSQSMVKAVAEKLPYQTCWFFVDQFGIRSFPGLSGYWEVPYKAAVSFLSSVLKLPIERSMGLTPEQDKDKGLFRQALDTALVSIPVALNYLIPIKIPLPF